MAKKLNITSVPMTLLYKNGDHVGTVMGLNLNELSQKMNVMLAEDASPAQNAAPGQDARPEPTVQEQPVRGRGGR